MPGCDVILVNADGRVVEQGNHNELMALKGVYYKLQMQSQKWALNPTALMWQNIAHPNFLMDFEVCHKMTREGSAPLKKRGVYALPGEKQGVHAKDFHRVASFALGGQPSNATSPLYGMYQLLSIKLAVRSEIPVRHREAQNMFQWMFFSGCWWIKCMLLCQFGCVWKLGVHMNTVYSPNNNVNGENDAWSSKFSLTRMNLKVIKFGGFCVGFDMICWM